MKEVLEELSKKGPFRKIVECLQVEVKAPKKESVDFTIEKALESGILDYLSKPDIKLCSLAYELKNENPIVLTLDYYMQNLCYFLGIKFGCIRGKCIKYAKVFRYECKNCKKLSKRVCCEICGLPGERKVTKVFKIPSNMYEVYDL